MGNYEDYYETLGVSDTATLEEIKRAYKDKCWIFGTDRMNGAPDSAKREAEEEHKKINQAYTILSDPGETGKVRYRATARGKSGAAKFRRNAFNKSAKAGSRPIHIEFKNVAPGEVKKASFTVFNTGGQYSKININNPDSWLRVVAWHSLSTS